MGRPQVVRISKLTSFTLMLNTGPPQGGVLNTLLYLQFMHVQPTSFSVHVHPTSFADDTIILGLITYCMKKRRVVQCIHDNYLYFNLSKTKERTVDRVHACLHKGVFVISVQTVAVLH